MTTTIESPREAWLAERRTGLGGSDAAAALGLSPYKSPYDLYLEKRGESTDEVLLPERVRWGNRLEDAIAEEYMERTGRKVHRVNRILRHPEHNFILANLDRRIVGELRGLEIKNVDKDIARFSEEWGEPGTDAVPTVYLLQTQHYMAVTGWEAWDLAALVGGNELRVYTIPRDEELIEHMIAQESAFWENVVAGVPPDIRTIEEAKARYPVSQPKTIDATDSIAAIVSELRSLKATAKEAEEAMDEAQARVLAFLGDHDTLMHRGAAIATWKSSKSSKRLDAKAFEAAHPDLAAQYVREFVGARRFLVKGEK